MTVTLVVAGTVLGWLLGWAGGYRRGREDGILLGLNVLQIWAGNAQGASQGTQDGDEVRRLGWLADAGRPC